MPDNPIPRPPAGDEGNAPKIAGSPWLTDPATAPKPQPEGVPQ